MVGRRRQKNEIPPLHCGKGEGRSGKKIEGRERQMTTRNPPQIGRRASTAGNGKGTGKRVPPEEEKVRHKNIEA